MWKVWGGFEAQSTVPHECWWGATLPRCTCGCIQVAAPVFTCVCSHIVLQTAAEAQTPLPWPAFDPPLCSFWKEHDGHPYKVTRHFSGYLHWVPAKVALKVMCRQQFTTSSSTFTRKMAKAMLPQVASYCGLSDESQVLTGKCLVVMFGGLIA